MNWNGTFFSIQTQIKTDISWSLRISNYTAWHGVLIHRSSSDTAIAVVVVIILFITIYVELMVTQIMMKKQDKAC